MTRRCERRANVLFFFVFSWFTLVAMGAMANDRRCPVCHEVFDEKVDVCPNDGTDLKLVGESVELSDDGTLSEQPPGSPEEPAAPNDVTPPEEAVDGEHKYIRQDKGGRRRRVQPADGDFGGDERIDRLRRLQDERAGVLAPKKRDTESGFSEEENARLRKQYKEIRDELASKRSIKREKNSPPHRQPLKTYNVWEQAAPVMSIGLRLSWMGEAREPGPLTGAEIDLNVLRTNIRVGLSSFIGIRSVSRNELIFLESISIGIQRPWRYAPYIVGRFGIGAIVSERFGETDTNLIRGTGFDTGVDCHLNDALTVTPSVGYVRYVVSSAAAWDSVALKLSIGF
ncbi:MAG: hypothetical protein JXR76_07155 [Deltaproteobacteria bacterium]|nr:hypothetical protein [Deltaproteobacteria bacterium]